MTPLFFALAYFVCGNIVAILWVQHSDDASDGVKGKDYAVLGTACLLIIAFWPLRLAVVLLHRLAYAVGRIFALWYERGGLE